MSDDYTQDFIDEVKGVLDAGVTNIERDIWNSKAEPIDIPSDAMSGIVTLDSLQGGVPFPEITVSGKNLIPFPYEEDSRSADGITWTVNSDGSVNADGTATSQTWHRIFTRKKFKAGTYTLSGCPKDGDLKYDINFVWYDTNNKAHWVIDSGKTITFTLPYDCSASMLFRVYNGITADNIVFRPQLEIGGTATAYESPITGHELTIQSCGKNLIPPDYMTKSGTYNGVTVNVKSDGRFDISGTAAAEGYLMTFLMNYPLIGGKKYTFNCSKQYDLNSFNCGFIIRDKNGTWKHGLDSYPKTIIADDGDYISSWRLWTNSGVEYSAANVEIQMEIGDTATEYEMPVGSTTTITPDSNPYTVPDDIRQHDGLNVVRVSAGELSVTGARENKTIKKVWDKLDELATAIVVSNSEL